MTSLRRLVFGTPLPTQQLLEERLSSFKALAVFSSDALSSVAYATEEILIALMMAGAMALRYTLPIALAISLLFIIVTISYRQTVAAYPNGGGAYIVAKENLGKIPGLTAGAALLVDYVLTVAVSISAGVAAITSAIPLLYQYRVPLGVLCVVIITVANLRGVREAGTIFTFPTYFFIVTMLVMVAVGVVRWFAGGLHPVPLDGKLLMAEHGGAFHPLTLFLLLKAFSSGCAALTGVEAIANGVTAFREPAAKNAAKTLGWLALLAIVLFMGITFLARSVGVLHDPRETVVSQVARAVFGNSFMYFAVQVATALILLLAANTSFAGFPRLSSLIARDGFLPRQLASLGDRLVFSNGIILLAFLSGGLIVIFNGQTHSLIPLYAVGVFASFTLSQSGMIVHWFKERMKDGRWRTHMMINGLGAITTLVVFIVIAGTKFTGGAWVVIIIIPMIIKIFMAVRSHYNDVAEQLHLDPEYRLNPMKHIVVVPVSTPHRAFARSLRYAKSLRAVEIHAVHVSSDPVITERLQAKWAHFAQEGVQLEILSSPYRSIGGPLVKYIKDLSESHSDCVISIVMAEFIPKRWWHYILHNETALLLNTMLHFVPNVVVVEVPFHLQY